MRISRCVALAALLVLPVVAAGQAPSTSEAQPPRILDTAVVTGVVPGPGLWKVRHGENTLWILGTQSPLPARMEWEPAKVRAAIGRSDAVLSPPGISVGGDLGFFGKLALLPSILKVRNNPDGKTLRDSVDPATYARWEPLRQRYFGSSRAIEKRRPLVAATELYAQAMKRSGLVSNEQVYDEIARAMKKRKLEWTRSTVHFKLPDIRGAMKELRRTRLDDGDCFERTLERLETDVGYMRLRANAWAVGDVEALRRLQRPDQFDACNKALLKSALAGKYGIDSAEAQADQKWLSNADAALRKNRHTFAVLPIREMFLADGLLAQLQAKGFVVEPPAQPIASR